MSPHRVTSNVLGRCPVSILTLVFLGSSIVAAQDKGTATCAKVGGVLLAEVKPGAWQAVRSGQDVPADAQLVALFENVLDSKNGAVKLKMTADIGQHGPLPVLESAIRLHANSHADLDFSLERGLVVLS